MRRAPFLDAAWPIAFAHRGGAAVGVENALSSFADVQRMGYRYVETDVRTTADGVPVVFHDEDTARVTGTPGRLGDLRLDEVRGLALDRGERVATLAETLEAFPDLRFNIDLKDAGAVRAVPPVLARAGAQHRVCVTSFAHRRVRAARSALGPEVCTGLGVAGVAGVLVTLGRGPRPRAQVLQVPWVLPGGRRLPRAVLDAGHRAGLAVHVWTVDDPAEMTAALDLGVDGVMTDEPAVLKDVLVRRGQWA